MGIGKKLLAERKWAFIFIFFILLFNPVFYFWADNISLKEKYLAWIACLVTGTALSCIDLFLKKKGEKIYLCILFFFSASPNLIVWGYLFMSRLYMKHKMYWAIFTTHYSESKEYVGHFISWEIALISLAYVLLGVFFIKKACSGSSLSLKKYGLLFAASLSVVLASIVWEPLTQAIPTFDLYKSRVLYWKTNYVFQQEREFRKDLKIDMQCTLRDSTDHVFVVIFGESTSACHMSLYGYHRETTPLMDARKDELDVYTDVVTPDTHTLGAMQKILTFADHEHPEFFGQKPSMVELFNAAGFETYWISNKEFLAEWRGSYSTIAHEAKHLYDLSPFERTDEVVLPYLNKILQDSIHGNKIIFMHLMGNHHAYNCRYTKEFEYFNYKSMGDLPDNGFRDKDMKKTIDEYDNSIRYGDFIFDSILRKIKELNKSSYLLFFSDHGEEVYDTRDAQGHFITNVYPCQARIPFVFWRSDVYKEEMPGIVIDTVRPYTAKDVIYSLSTLSGLEYKDNDPGKSLFSPEYVIPQKRLVGDEDYVDILKKVK